MRKITFLGFLILILCGVAEVKALPIPAANTFGERNAILIGALVFVSFGAILGACVCCRRRKKGFEEFQNESGTLESNRTEYPIFRALSPESQRNTAVANNIVAAADNSHDDLIEADFDNNNGPISPADLENIENNNAVDYIQNQNEIGAVPVEPSQYSRNRNLVENHLNAESNYNQHNHNESDTPPSDVHTDFASCSRMSSDEQKETLQSPEREHNMDFNDRGILENNRTKQLLVLPVEVHNHIGNFEPNNTDNSTDDLFYINDDLVCNSNIVEESIILQSHVPIVNASVSRIPETEFKNEELDQTKSTVIDFETKDEDKCVNFEQNRSLDTDEVTIVNECSSVKSYSSEKSVSDTNSVEEALRVLDNAIAGEDFLSPELDGNYMDVNDAVDDDRDLNADDFQCNNPDFQDVIRQLLINNGATSFLSELKDECIVIDKTEVDTATDDSIDNIRDEANKFVDAILSESQRVAMERVANLTDPSNKQYPNETTTLNLCTTIQNAAALKNICIVNYEKSEHKMFLQMNKNELQEKEKTDKLSPCLTPAESIENIFFNDLVAKTSTPYLQHKYTGSGENHCLEKKNIVQSLFDKSFPKAKQNDIDVSNPCLKNSFEEQNSKMNDATRIVAVNQTYNANDKTFDLNSSEDQQEFVYPGDPCTSKQALERDSTYPLIKYDRDEVNSEDMTTITPVNTPIELNYPHDTWDKMTKSGIQMEAGNGTYTSPPEEDLVAKGFGRGGWFLHPQSDIAEDGNATFDIEDDANLELTFEALRKQLAEVLPQPQGMAGPTDFSDDEDEAHENRTFDEYRSPLDGLAGLIDMELAAAPPTQNELFINYKRPLSPIIEESEEETCKTFVMNETKCLDSTSTGCVDTGEAIMGVTKTLMASNDTLFNFEDTLGEREDVFSPRTPSRTETQTNTPVKNNQSTDSSMNGSETEKTDHLSEHNPDHNFDTSSVPERRSPPKTISFVEPHELMQESDLCSPEQQKTFSEGTSSTTDRLSSDVSPTVDHDTTFNTITIDDKTCVTVIIKDDERISEISEPEWGSTASYGGAGGYDMNSLTDVPSLDFNVNEFDANLKEDDKKTRDIEYSSEHQQYHLRINDNQTLLLNSDNGQNSYVEDDNDAGHDDSGHSTQISTDEKSTSVDEEEEIQPANNDKLYDGDNANDKLNDMKQNLMNQQLSPSNLHNNLDDRQNCLNFLHNEIEDSSSQNGHSNNINSKRQNDTILALNKNQSDDADSVKENKNPNSKEMLMLNRFVESPDDKASYQKVQNNSQDAVIIDNGKNISLDIFEKDLSDSLHENLFFKPEISILPVKHQQTIINYSINDVSGIQGGEQNCLIVADEMLGHLSGEEDPWVEPLNDIRFTGPCSEIISTSFTVNEWDSDVDDSHSSEEFMYVRGSPPNTNESHRNMPSTTEISNNLKNATENQLESTDENNYESHVWSSHEDQIPVGAKNDVLEEEISDGSSSEFEGEFVPSCWDSMATPARSALKSPDKSSSEEEPKCSENKKRRSVVFKKQRYHSVYEYPRESTSLSPAYSEPFLWNRNFDSTNYFSTKGTTEKFDDGFTVSSTMRPFHGSQFNALCHTWPPDSDFSWSQVEEILPDDQKLATYSNIEIKWPQTLLEMEKMDGNDVTNDFKIDESKRPDSGVGESAEMLSERSSVIGELCHTKSNLRLPIDISPPAGSVTEAKQQVPEHKENNGAFVDVITLPTPSCTGSMDSLSSSSGSERQVSFSTFGKRNSSSSDCDKKKSLEAVEQQINRPSLILIENDPILDINTIKVDKIRQSDSTDEDSGIESIMKVNKEND